MVQMGKLKRQFVDDQGALLPKRSIRRFSSIKDLIETTK
jgi:hypothetical protein